VDLSKAQRRLSAIANGQDESMAGSPPATSPMASRFSVPPSPAFSRGSSVERDGSLGPEASKKVLRIKRMVSSTPPFFFLSPHCRVSSREKKKVLVWANLERAQIDGEWKYEIVRDPAVIAAYVRKRQTIEEETTLADTLAPTGDAEKDARARKRCVFGCKQFSPPIPLRYRYDVFC
jgi:transcription initiation factor TFIID subunit 1, fungi type